jgi:hypothetical protein
MIIDFWLLYLSAERKRSTENKSVACIKCQSSETDSTYKVQVGMRCRGEETVGRRRYWRRVFKDWKGEKEGGAKMLRRRDLCALGKSLKTEAPTLCYHPYFPEKLQAI